MKHEISAWCFLNFHHGCYAKLISHAFFISTIYREPQQLDSGIITSPFIMGKIEPQSSDVPTAATTTSTPAGMKKFPRSAPSATPATPSHIETPTKRRFLFAMDIDEFNRQDFSARESLRQIDLLLCRLEGRPEPPPPTPCGFRLRLRSRLADFRTLWTDWRDLRKARRVTRRNNQSYYFNNGYIFFDPEHYHMCPGGRLADFDLDMAATEATLAGSY
ncbi:hypothetical protein F4778DRAFT_538844 [Xylariomycetidae sp. FL2044]|nr:hypothetical protein F4778DRAFT_538844 [Xylariomycetidae sp. FL2044]